MPVPDALLPFEHRLVSSTLVASSTVLVYDLLCTLDQEIAYVWSNPWAVSSMLFFLNRYVPFIDTFLSLALKFSTKPNEKCLIYYTVVTWLIVLGTMFSEVILMLRTYAIWERKRGMLLGLTFLAGIVLIPAIILTNIEVHSLEYAKETHGCRLIRASPIILIAYLLLVLSETILVMLTIIKGYRHFRHCQSGWVLQLYKDGVMFYFYVLAISLANIIVPIVAPSVFANWLATPQRVIHSILCNHVLFLIFRQRSASMTNQHLPGAPPNTRQPYDSFAENENETSHNMTIVAPSTTSVLGVGEDEVMGLHEIEYDYRRDSSASDRASGSRLRTSITLEEEGRSSESREGVYSYSSDRRHGLVDEVEHRYKNNGNS